MLRFYFMILIIIALLVYMAMAYCPPTGLISYLHC